MPSSPTPTKQKNQP
ncbi:hypothetical protein U9M48_030892 [Paspalum notatum var. saurae]|uniref:Uncharacterized protein n=1 Tax=Paspalum notatum var. saurae TaxID=547442 RepID=A0AAQ3U1P9_PASNO